MISIIIPTKNEEHDLPLALDSIKQQSIDNYEIIVVDSNSIDRTRKIAETYGSVVINYPAKPLGARVKGFEHSTGEIILFMDADQILKNDILERIVSIISEYDMIVLEERSYCPETWVQKKLASERNTLHTKNPMDNLGKGLYPRVFKRTLLKQTFDEIKKIDFDKVFAYDDQILFEISSRFSKKIGYLNESLYHIEEKGVIELIKHSYNLGKSARITNQVNTISQINNHSFRENIINSIKNRCFLISLIRKFAFEFGYMLN
jgi:glycosyltransferase involved in cell wall biosynthesis